MLSILDLSERMKVRSATGDHPPKFQFAPRQSPSENICHECSAAPERSDLSWEVLANYTNGTAAIK